MATIKMISYDEDQLQDGKFYHVRITKGSLPAMIEVPFQETFEVDGIKRFQTDGNINTSIRALETFKSHINNEIKVGYRDVDIQKIYIDNKIIINFNSPFTGQIIKN